MWDFTWGPILEVTGVAAGNRFIDEVGLKDLSKLYTILYLWHVSFGNITAPSLSIFLSAGAHLCRKAKFNKKSPFSSLAVEASVGNMGGGVSIFQGLLHIQMGLCGPKPVFIQSGLIAG